MSEATEHRYAVADVFPTVQGEGSNAGRFAVFIRLAGCNAWNGKPESRMVFSTRAACAVWCDTDFTVKHRLTGGEIAEMVRQYPHALVVITGGEPLLQVDDALVTELREVGVKEVWIETNGSVPPKPGLEGRVNFTVSPKRGLGLSEEFLRDHRIAELKVVLPGSGGKHTGWSTAELRELAARTSARHLFVQPQDVTALDEVSVTHLVRGKREGIEREVWRHDAAKEYERRVAACVDWVSRNPTWRISGQLHKLLSLA